jgi:hypothetical protein
VIITLKAAVFVTLLIALNALYFAPQRWPLHAAIEMPAYWLDRAIPFSEWWIPVYWSFYPLIVLGGIFLATRGEMVRFASGLLGQSIVACVIFFVWPTMVTRPIVIVPGWAYQAVVAMDHPLNACPSLHASYSVYCAVVLNGVLRSVGGGEILRAGVWLWVLVIFVSTIGLRQHVVMDLAAGTVLALAALKVRPVLERS